MEASSPIEPERLLAQTAWVKRLALSLGLRPFRVEAMQASRFCSSAATSAASFSRALFTLSEGCTSMPSVACEPQ